MYNIDKISTPDQVKDDYLEVKLDLNFQLQGDAVPCINVYNN